MMSSQDFNEKQIIVAFLNHGEKFSFKNDNVVITDSEGHIKYQSTCYRLFSLFVVGHVTITSGLIQRAKKFGFSIVFMTYTLRVYAVIAAGAEGNVLLRKKQYEYTGLELAQHIVRNKISNQIQVLTDIREKDDDTLNAIDQLREYLGGIGTGALELKSLLGTEGVVARIYFQRLFAPCDWTARRPRVKHDMTNCLMDIGYTLLFNVIEALLSLYGFDLYNGVYHRQFYQRKSLVCDIMEPFRPLVDMKIRKAYRLGQCKEEDFDCIQGQYRLYGQAAAPYIQWLMEPIIEKKQLLFKYVRSYYRAFMKGSDFSDYPVFKIKES